MIRNKYTVKYLSGIVLLFIMTFSFLSCGQTIASKKKNGPQAFEISKLEPKLPIEKKDGRVFYQLFVRSFYDTNNDGIGDLDGVTEKLDYLQELGVNGIWLNPIYPSPSYHGYDVTDYRDVNKDYGTMDDLEELLSEAHKRDIKVILDFVPNHTSSKHPWFKEAITSEKNKYRDYYVWADKTTDLKELSDIDQKAWNKKGEGYYYANFWSEMPDLNFDNKKVREEIKNTAKFWLEKGVDGFRIDAARHIFPKNRRMDTMLWWKEFGDFVRGVNKDAYIVGEVWTDESIVAPYFKVMDSAFNFKVGEQIIGALAGGNSTKLSDIMESAYSKYAAVNKDFVDAPFLTNHDMDRSMSKLKDVDKMKSAAAIYLTLPGNPFIYYGEEIGMLGAKPDEGIREPFIWYKNGGKGQTSWEAIQYNRAGEVESVEKQEDNKDSLLNFYRDIIKYRLSSDVLTRGDIKIIKTDSNSLAYTRSYKGQTNLVVHNIGGKEITLEIALASDTKLSGSVIKGEGNLQVEEGKVIVKLKPYSFVIIN